jgi:two-component system LytT family response regulator
MRTIKTVLIDDEEDSLETIELLLQRHCPEVEIAGKFSEPKKAIAAIPKLNPQLLLLDIQMPGMTGFELLQELKDFSGGVVFITAHSEHAIRAFKFSAVDYLLKPVYTNELKAAIAKVKKASPSSPADILLKELTENIRNFANPAFKKISVSTSEGIEMIPLEDITCLKADRNYTYIYRNSQKELLVAKPLKEFENNLPKEHFIRVHSSCIVNIDKVAKYIRQEGGLLQLVDGTIMNIGRKYKEAVLEKLKQ